MVKRPSDYPWSSYHCNALGELNDLITNQIEYKRLGKTKAEREIAYKQLFRNRIPESTLESIRDATNKAWVLGSTQFKKKIGKS